MSKPTVASLSATIAQLSAELNALRNEVAELRSNQAAPAAPAPADSNGALPLCDNAKKPLSYRDFCALVSDAKKAQYERIKLTLDAIEQRFGAAVRASVRNAIASKV